MAKKNGNGTAIVESSTIPSIAAFAQGNLVAVDDEAVNAFALETKDDTRAEVPSLPLIRIDHRNEVFLVNGEPAETIEGYPVNWFQTRAWWAKGFKAGEHNPPDCSSLDTVKPAASSPQKQSEACYSCPMAAFGSATVGDGQACRVTTFLCILNPAFGNPPVGVLLAPPTSIRDILGTSRNPGYLARAKQFKTPRGNAARYYEIVWSRFRLERASDTHCVIVPEPVAVAATAEETRAIAMVRRGLLAEMEAVRGKVLEGAGAA